MHNSGVCPMLSVITVDLVKLNELHRGSGETGHFGQKALISYASKVLLRLLIFKRVGDVKVLET